MAYPFVASVHFSMLNDCVHLSTIDPLGAVVDDNICMVASHAGISPVNEGKKEKRRESWVKM